MMELHAYPHLWDVHWDDDLFTILYDDSLVEILGSHPIRFAFSDT